MRAIITAAAVLLLIGLYILIDIKLSKQRFLPKSICFGIFTFFSVFMIVSEILFALKTYSLLMTFSIIAGIGTAILAAALLIKPPKAAVPKAAAQKAAAPARTPLPRRFYTYLIILVAAGFLVTGVKFGIFGMGQDQGIYQMTAILRTQGYNDIALDLNGYHTLAANNPDDAHLYMHAVNTARYNENSPDGNLRGYYTGSYSIYLQDTQQSPVEGYMHGLPNYSAMLSLSGIIFGITGLLHIQTLFFAVTICLLFMTLYLNLNLKMSVAVTVTTLFILSPIVIWITRAALTESFTTLMFTAFIYLLTSPDSRSNSMLWLPPAVFSFFHVSIYTIMPLFVILFLFLYVQKRERAIIFSAVAALLSYAAGFLAMLQTSGGYIIDNYRRLRNLISLQDLGDNAFVLFVVITAVIAAALTVAACLLIKRCDLRLNTKAFLIISKYIMILCFVYIMFTWLSSVFGRNGGNTSAFVKDIIMSAPNVTLGSYAILTGCLALPLVMFGLFMKKEYFAQPGTAALVVVFLYCIMIYSAILRRNTTYFYYFARYLAPFLPVILILAGVFIDKISIKARAVFAGVSAMLLLPFSFFAVTNRDLSKIDTKSFELVVDTVRGLADSDIVIISPECMSLFFIPLDYINGPLILPPGDDYGIVAERLAENPSSSGANQARTGNVFFLSINREEKPDPGAMVLIANESNYHATGPGRLMPLPMTAAKGEYLIELKKLT